MKKLKRLFYTLVALVGGTRSTEAATTVPRELVGDASYYARHYIGRKMANGRPYNPADFTMASWDYPLGTLVQLTYVSSGGQKRSVVVEVTDRGPAKDLVAKGRIFDLSWTAFRQLENPKKGVIRVTAKIVE